MFYCIKDVRKCEVYWSLVNDLKYTMHMFAEFIPGKNIMGNTEMVYASTKFSVPEKLSDHILMHSRRKLD